jgi:hypothetical protein
MLQTDHMAQKFLKDKRNLNGKLIRYSMALQEFNFEIFYIKGPHDPADFLSRCNALTRLENLYTPKDQMKLQRILREYHFYSGHASLERMFFLLKFKYNWKSMRGNAKDWIVKCDICKRAGRKALSPKNLII